MDSGDDPSQPTDSPEWRPPRSIRQFWWDLLPASIAPENSGLPDPTYEPPAWLSTQGAATPEAADYAQRAHDQAKDRVSKAEDKASRLVQISLALLTITLALAGFQLNVSRRLGGGWRYLLVVPAGLGMVFLVLAGIGALEIDRVALYSPGTVEEVATADDLVRARTGAEERARWYADLMASAKLSALLQARAWLSRSLLCLFVAGALAAASQAVPARDSRKPLHTGRSPAPDAATIPSTPRSS